MEFNTKASGLGISEMEQVGKNGLMEQSMMANGSTTKLKVKESLLIQMETSMKVNGPTTRQMATAYISIIKQELSMKDIGRTICSMVQVCKFTAMVTSMKECLNKEEETEKEAIIIPLDKFIKAVGLMGELKDMEYVSGRMEKNMKEIGSTTKNMGMECIHGLTKENTRVTIEMTKNMARGHIHGLMVDNISVNGKTIKGMEKELM